MQPLLFIAQGLGLSLALLLGGLLIGLCLGTCLAVLRYQAIGLKTIALFVSVIRGTPLILQLSFVYFSFPMLLGLKLSILTAGIITFGVNSGAYVSEILRSGIESLPKGQFEAAKTLHIPRFFMWRDIILPQVMRNILPAMVHETITLLKETALISTLGGMDIMRRAQAVAAEQFTYFMPLCIAGCYYYVLVLLIEYAGKKLEQKVAYASHH